MRGAETFTQGLFILKKLGDLRGKSSRDERHESPTDRDDMPCREGASASDSSFMGQMWMPTRKGGIASRAQAGQDATTTLRAVRALAFTPACNLAGIPTSSQADRKRLTALDTIEMVSNQAKTSSTASAWPSKSNALAEKQQLASASKR